MMKGFQDMESKPPRRLYVTHEEFDQLQQWGHESAIHDTLHLALPFRESEADANDEAAVFARKVSDLLDVSLGTLAKYTWHVEVVDVVRRRMGRAWATRGLVGTFGRR